ncbi:HECT domain protein [Aspergillus lucknowensis]|uniref:HECT-type E3 ubiquitin transferase n=1 Tax=Aspergillus lucknowensis TaxID=176173 RepID=A0ABR4M0X5_9EURO
MTRLRGPSVGSFEGSRGIDRPQCHRSKLPSGAPDVISQHTVNVSDPAQVLLWYRDERRRQFNLLVRRYKNQLLYGCQNPGCETPTCASYRRRVTEGPYRRYTELSARTLACYLASLDNAESGLCRHSPRVHPELSSQDPQRRSKRRNRASPLPSPTRDCSDSTVLAKGPRRADLETSHIPNGTGRQHHLEDDVVRSKHSLNPPEPASPPSQRLKDPKSFTQNLFDTLALRMIEWLPLRRSPGSFDFDQGRAHQCEPPRSPNSDTCQAHLDSDKDLPQYKQRPNQTDSSVGSNPHTPSSRSTGQTTAVELKLPNQQFKRLSLTETELRRSNSKSSLEEKSLAELKPARKLSVSTHATPSVDEFVNVPSPPALRHRSQKHRGRVVDQNSTRSHEQAKKERRVSWDGSKFLNDVQSARQGGPMIDTIDVPSPNGQPSHRRHQRRHSPHLARDVTTIQSLSHLNGEIIDGLKQMLILSEDEAETWKEELAIMEYSGSFEDYEWRFATSRQREVFTFMTQSVFYALGSARQLLHSFRDNTASPNNHTVTSQLDLQQLKPALRKLFSICPKDIIFHSLWNALEALFVPPRELSTPSRLSRRSSYTSNPSAPASAPIIIRRASDASNHEYVTDANAADVAAVVLFALATSLPEIDPITWSCIVWMRSTGNVAMNTVPEMFCLQDVVEATDVLEDELALRLVDRLVRAVTARSAFHEISKTRCGYTQDSAKRSKNVLDSIVELLGQGHDLTGATVDNKERSLRSPGTPAIITEWLRTLFLKNWDGNPEMARSSSEGGVVQILSVLFKERSRLGLVAEDFHTPFLSERLDPLEMPVQWMARVPSNKTLHLLSYSFLFPPSALVIYFRALNYSAMSKYYEAAMTTTRHVTQTAFGAIEVQDDVGLLARMKTSMTTYLVLVIRRDNILTDALNQLWRRERRELMRPLKVQMGMDEGEEGLDHGGVQQEFFRLLMAEALDSEYGMFTTDSRTRVSWFQPCSWEPLYKFELLGLLMSLAIYNGLTLPVNFPTAFYRKLLGLKVKHLEHIRDGWPELTRGLEELLRWSEGDVGDIFMRTYEFGFDSFGRVETVDMERIDRDSPWPLSSAPPQSGGRSVRYSPSWSDVLRYTDQASLSPPSSMAAETADSRDDAAKSVAGSVPLPSPTPPAEEAALVTNENRGQFVKDYIFWLTDKSIRPQFEAFAQGFYTCLDRSSLAIFTPEALKTVVEGIQEIDIAQLERHARYEGGFGPEHRVIRDFWNIAGGFSTGKKAQLLEFVTASDRVPVNGIESIMFVIQKNGVGDARLPTSLTCFGRLLLPEYSSKGVLEEKLNKALENARGFGVA